MAGVFTSPEKGPVSSIDGLDDSFWDVDSRHIMQGDSAKHSSDKCKPAITVEKRSAPSREVFITRGDQR